MIAILISLRGTRNQNQFMTICGKISSIWAKNKLTFETPGKIFRVPRKSFSLPSLKQIRKTPEKYTIFLRQFSGFVGYYQRSPLWDATAYSSSVIFQNIVCPISEVWHETLTALVRMDILGFEILRYSCQLMEYIYTSTVVQQVQQVQQIHTCSIHSLWSSKSV